MAHKTGLALLLAALLGGCAMPSLEGLRTALPGRAAPEPVVDGPAVVMLAPRQVALRPIGPEGPRRIWRGEGNIAIETAGPRVVATAGLPRQLLYTRFESPDPLDDPGSLAGREATARRLVDVGDAGRDPAAMRFGLLLDCTLGARPEADWLLVEERCTGSGLAFTNRFWADPATGRIARSEQWAGDGMPPLSLRMQER
jgi:hypothetical protein